MWLTPISRCRDVEADVETGGVPRAEEGRSLEGAAAMLGASNLVQGLRGGQAKGEKEMT
jgi:hypothetical protein